MSFFEIWLLLFTFWSFFSLFLLFRALHDSSIAFQINDDHAPLSAPLPESPPSPQKISIFKPTPPLSTSFSFDFESILPPLESFLSQMTKDHEMLLGISKRDFPAWQKIVDHWKTAYPQTTIKVIHENDHSLYSNPKIDWNHTLSKEAQGDLWLWSDLDITVAPHYLHHLTLEWNLAPSGYLTNAYHIPTVHQCWGIWDALFLHFEFLPGVFLLHKRNRFHTAFGAGILFPAQTFAYSSAWNQIGNHLADDFHLARLIGHGRLSHMLVQTTSRASSFREGFWHYLRWHKTVRWCDPCGYAGLFLLLPLLGSLFASVWSLQALRITAAAWLLELLIGGIILFKTVKPLSLKMLPPLLLWPWLRLFAWIWSWLPTSVKWGGTDWNSPIKSTPGK